MSETLFKRQSLQSLLDKKCFIIDTNILLADANSIFLLGKNHTIILTETVLDEIDKFKSGTEDKNYQAREMNRILSECNIIEQKNNHYLILSHEKENINIIIVPDKSEDKKPDKRIINTGINFIKEYEKLLNIDIQFKFLSNDINFRTQVFLQGYIAEPFFNNQTEEIIDFIGEFEIEKVLPNKDYLTLKEIKENYNLEIKNEYSFIKIKDGNGFPGLYIRENKNNFRKINKDTLNLFGVKGKNLKQNIALNQFLNIKNDIFVIDSVAGTGKTLLSLVAALQLQKKGIIDNIIYIRKTIISGDTQDELGFLPGDLNEKLSGYMHPLRDNIELLVKLKNKKKKHWTKEELEIAIKNFEIEHNIYYEYEGHLRGRNLTGAIIYDEAQNDSIANLKTLLTRITEGSKVFILGSSGQIDNPYLNKFNNALTFMKNNCGTFEPIQIQGIKLEKSERGKIVQWIEEKII